MTWTAWRRARSVVFTMAVVIVAVVAVLLLMGVHQQLVWSEYLRRPCRGGFPTGHLDYCERAVAQVSNASRYNTLIVFVVIALGPLFGVVLGVIAVAQEIERRTVRLSWTQSQSRQKWLASSFLVNIATLVVLFVPLCLVATWWNRVAHYAPRIRLNGFPITGFSILFMSIFAFVLVGTVGMFVRKSGWTFAVGFVVAIACIYAWQKSNGIALVGSTNAPSTATMNTLSRRLSDCYASPMGKEKNGDNDCIHKTNIEFFALYVPDSEYWTVQLREGSIYAGITLLLAGAGFLTVRRMLA